jgi:dimethylamine/trimethylamine dehydrogenase
MNWVANLPGLLEWRRVIEYRKVQLDKQTNIKVISGMRLDTDQVLGYGSNIVILATGSHWAKDGDNRIDRAPIPGANADLPNILTPDQIMVEGKPVTGDRVLIYDFEGYFMGASMAEKLARDGHKVHFVTPYPGVSPYMDFTGENLHMIPMLKQLGVELTTSHIVTGIQEGKVSGLWGLEPDVPLEWDADCVVLVTSRIPNEALYRELNSDPNSLSQAGITGVFRVGDCVAPRMCVADAIFDGHRLAREIDTEDPSEPVLFLRERAILEKA